MQNSAQNGVLAARSVSYGYRAGEPVLRHFSADLEGGAVTALLGPNAVGKSTLLSLLLGHRKPASGQCLLRGEDVYRQSPARRAAAMSYVGQDNHLAFAFTVRDVVEMSRYALSYDPALIDEALELCELTEIAHRSYTGLSAGQQQRVILSRAIAQLLPGPFDDKVMLMDEPLSHMDLRYAHDAMTLLRDLASRGLAVLVVLHDLNLAARYADHIWLMHEGQLLVEGSWKEVLKPEILEPVYRVPIEVVAKDDHPRPILIVN